MFYTSYIWTLNLILDRVLMLFNLIMVIPSGRNPVGKIAEKAV